MPVCGISVILSDDPSGLTQKSESKREPPYSSTNRYPAPLVDAQKLTADWSDREVYLLTFDLSKSDLDFSPGDSLDIMPENDPVLVEKLLKRLNLNGSKRLTVKSLEGSDKEMAHIEPFYTLRYNSYFLCSR